MRRYIAWAILCLVAAGCDSDKVNVGIEWSKAIERFEVTPVYPMQEDIYVGDVLLYVPNQCKDDGGIHIANPRWLGSLAQAQVRDDFDVYFKDRPRLPQTHPPKNPTPVPKEGIRTPEMVVSAKLIGGGSVTAIGGGQSSSGSSSASSSAAAGPLSVDSPEGGSIYTREKERKGDEAYFKRVPMLAYPAVSLFTYQGASLGVSAPVGGPLASVFGGIAGQSANQLSIKANQVERAELPSATVLRRFRNYVRTPEAQAVFAPDNILPLVSVVRERQYNSGCRISSEVKRPMVVFVTGVLYTRSLEFSFGKNSAFAARLAATLAGQNAVPTSSQLSTTTLPDTSGNPAQVAANSLSKALSGMSGSPGINGTLAIGSEGDLVLNQSYERAMAFGLSVPLICPLEDVMSFYGSGATIRPDAQCSYLFQAPVQPAAAAFTQLDRKQAVQCQACQGKDLSDYDKASCWLRSCPIGNVH
jgi:hypothetical protein